MIDQTVSHYKILEKLGEGGMGVVYKAEDQRLKRPVALKFLPPHLTGDREAMERFVMEAQAASALDHQNICTIYQIDESTDGRKFISMAYYDGATLKSAIANGPLSVESAIDIAIQIAQGLAKAHEKGIVHRDIKPGNIIIRTDGTVKIIDFGLSKLLGGQDLTQTGTTKGTVAYMAPEQALGKVVDHRADIWALGVVLYEMLCGQKPFQGDYDQAVIYRIINQPHPELPELNPDIPQSLVQIVEKALQKKPGDRYQHIEELRTDLQHLKDAGNPGDVFITSNNVSEISGFGKKTVGRRSIQIALLLLLLFIAAGMYWYSESAGRVTAIAVLPLVNLSGDPQQDYFADGMTEALINDLAKISALRVISRTSVMRYKDSDKTLPEIARELGVDALVEGAVRMIDDRVQVTAQLVDGRSDRHLWAESYDRNLQDVLQTHREITGAIARQINVPLTETERKHFTDSQAVNPEAYRLFLQGKYFAEGMVQDPEKAIAFFEQSIALDSTFALAYANYAIALNRFEVTLGMDRNLVLEKGLNLAKRAVELNGQLPEAHIALAVIQFWQEWNWRAADEGFKRAFQIEPNRVHPAYLSFLVAMQRKEEGVRVIKQMLQVDPVSPRTNLDAGWAYYHFGMYEESIRQLKHTADMIPNSHWPHMELAWNYALTGEFEKAIEKCNDVEKLRPGTYSPLVGWVYAVSGELDKAMAYRQVIDSLLADDPVHANSVTATLYAALGEFDKAFDCLESGFRNRTSDMVLFKAMTQPGRVLGKLRSDPRYLDLLNRMNYPEY